MWNLSQKLRSEECDSFSSVVRKVFKVGFSRWLKLAGSSELWVWSIVFWIVVWARSLEPWLLFTKLTLWDACFVPCLVIEFWPLGLMDPLVSMLAEKFDSESPNSCYSRLVASSTLEPRLPVAPNLLISYFAVSLYRRGVWVFAIVLSCLVRFSPTELLV